MNTVLRCAVTLVCAACFCTWLARTLDESVTQTTRNVSAILSFTAK